MILSALIDSTVQTVQGRKLCPSDPLLGLYSFLSVCVFLDLMPAAGALCQSTVGLCEEVLVQTSFPGQPGQVKPLLGSLHCDCGVESPARV